MRIPPINCKGFDVELQELPIEQAIDVARLDIKRIEDNLTTFLRMAVKQVNGKIGIDPANWTAQQRYLAMGQYLSQVIEGDPNFYTGQYQYHDYLLFALQHDLCNVDNTWFLSFEDDSVGGDDWVFTPLLGWKLSAIETIAEDYTDWVFCSMAATLCVNGEEKTPLHSASTPIHDYTEWLIERVKTLKKFPESDFIALQYLFQRGLDESAHFFRLWFDDKGVVILHGKEGIDGQHGLESTRFLATNGVRAETKGFC